MTLALTFRPDAEAGRAFAGQAAAVMNAAQAALAAAGARIEKEGMASIAAGGFDAAWQRALKVRVRFNGGGGDISVSHAIPYAAVFEFGAVIQGAPLLWLPLPSCPKRIGGRHPTPSAYQASIGPLRYSAGGAHPLLIGVSAAPPKGPAPIGVRRLSGPGPVKIGALRAGAKNGGYSVPMFFGVSSVTIGKKFDVLGVVERAYADLAAQFSASLEEG
ncbi:MAG: hypothetical protein KGL35_00350 [Bradyrhizobium sp.]|nr:hypothetical protein [Bradyrhizobium sp.]